jgi:type II secretory pathway pseudopilin PulG
MILDALIGLAIVGALVAALLVGMNRQRGAAERMANTRGATWAAEQALTEMQAGRKPSGSEIRVDPSPADGAAPAGYAWVRVRAERNGRATTLIGLVPAAVVPTGEKGGPR